VKITSQNLAQTISINKEIKREIDRIINVVETRYKKIRILSTEKQALQILKEHYLIQIPIPDENWGGAIRELPNDIKVFVINTAQPRVYQYFIYWHEIYHLIAGFEESTSHLISTEFEIAERKADYFASQMLLGPDVYEYYNQLDNSLLFIEKIMHCIDTFKAPYKAILIQLFESADEYKNKQLLQEIHQHFDIKLKQAELENLFLKLSLDVTLVQPSNIIDLGVLEAKIRQKRHNNKDVEMYKEHEEFIIKFKQSLEELKNG
jgi:hypothetical protein